MKTNRKTMVSLSVALSVVFAFLAASSPMKVPTVGQSSVEISSGRFRLASVSYKSNFSVGFYNYYNQLDGNQKVIYNRLKELTPASGEIEISLANAITYSVSSSNPTEAEQKPALDEVSRLVQGALDAVLKDCPEIFWLRFSGNPSTSYSPVMYVNSRSGRHSISVNSVMFFPAIINSYQGAASQIAARLQTEVQNFPGSGGTRYEKLLSIHDGLARRFAYDKANEPSERAYDAYGALAAGGVVVCEGYSEAFKLICDYNNIPCILVTGIGVTSSGHGPHMWNAVQMEDGKWYGVDVTWDDQTDNPNSQKDIYYACFLAGSDTGGGVFGSRKFSESHIESGFFTETDYSKQFAYPEFSAKKYEPGSGEEIVIDNTNEIIVPQVQNKEAPAPTAAATQPVAQTTAAPKTNANTTVKNNTTAKADVSQTAVSETEAPDSSSKDESASETTKAGYKTGKDSFFGTLSNIAPFIIGGLTVCAVIVIILVLILRRKI